MRSLLLLAGVVEALVSPRTATLGLGCFWEPSEKLLKLDGVVDTRCGYAGAAFPDARPDYNSVCGGDGNVVEEAFVVTMSSIDVIRKPKLQRIRKRHR